MMTTIDQESSGSPTDRYEGEELPEETPLPSPPVVTPGESMMNFAAITAHWKSLWTDHSPAPSSVWQETESNVNNSLCDGYLNAALETKPKPRDSHSTVVYQGKLYIYAGWLQRPMYDEDDDDEDEDEDEDDAVVFNDLWGFQFPSEALAGRSGSGDSSGKGEHVVGPSSSSSSRWTQLLPATTSESIPFIPSGRWGHTAHVVGTSMVVVGGSPQSLEYGTSMEVLRYDFKRNQWISLKTKRVTLQPPQGSSQSSGSSSSPNKKQQTGSQQQASTSSSRGGQQQQGSEIYGQQQAFERVSTSSFNYDRYINTIEASTISSLQDKIQAASASRGVDRQQQGGSSSPLTSSGGALRSPKQRLPSKIYSSTGGSSQRSAGGDVGVLNASGRLQLEPYQAPLRYCHSTVVFNDLLVIYGGLENAESCYEDVICVDVKAKEEDAAILSQMMCANTPKARFCHSAVVVGERMLVFGGSSPGEENENFNDIWELNLHSFVWSPVELSSPFRPDGRFLHTALADQHGCMYIFGGKSYDLESPVVDMLCYADPLKQWFKVQSHRGPFPQSISGMSCSIVSDTVVEDEEPTGAGFSGGVLAGLRAILFGGEDEDNEETRKDVIELFITQVDRSKLLLATPTRQTTASILTSHEGSYFDLTHEIPPSAAQMALSTENTTLRRVPAAATNPVLTSSGGLESTTTTQRSASPTVGPSTAATAGDPSQLAAPANAMSTTGVHSALLQLMEQIHRDMCYRFDELEHRLNETNGRVDRLRDTMLAGRRGDGPVGGSPGGSPTLQAEQRVYNEMLLAEVRTLREQQAVLQQILQLRR